MIQFNKVVLHNFGSYKHAEITLDSKGFCLVSGRNNYKKDNAFSNGSGKSFLWSAICFALTGETINGLHSNLRNINADESDKLCNVQLYFKVNTNNYIITRQITPSSDLKIIKDNEDISGKGIRESEKKLGELLPDLNKDLIASTIIIGQGMPNKFSSYSPSGRKELLEKLTKSDFMIEDLKHRVGARATELSKKLRETEDSLLVNKTQLTSTKDLLERAKKSLELKVAPDFDKEIAEASTKIKSINKDLIEVGKVITELSTQVDTETNKLLGINTEKTSRLNEEYSAYSTASTEANKTVSELNASIRALKAEIKRLKSITDICPTCGQKLIGVEKPDTAEQEAECAKLEADLKEAQNKITSISTKHNGYLQDINEEFDQSLKTTQASLNTNKAQLNKYKNDQNDYSHYISIEQEKINRLTFEKSNWDASINNLKSEINDLETKMVSINNALTLTTNYNLELAEHMAVIKKMETLLKRDFRGYLLTNIIRYIDTKAKDYCEIVFGTRELNVYLDGNALDISYNNKMFDNLSGGEKQRVDLILQFAIRNMLITYLGLNSNILVLDEITDFLDKQSCAAIMKLVETELNTIESVFIISHHAEELELPIDSEIHIIKNENGISEVL